MALRRAACSLAVLLLVCSASTSLAQSEDSASIIQTTIMAFRLTGNAASNFSTPTQTKFSDQLRALLQSFNFMSVAVSDYTAAAGALDVSVRAADATDAQNLTSTWETIASQAMVSNTFMSTFNALLTNAGVQVNATLTSINGVTNPAGVNVTFDVNMTLSGGSNLTPFSDSNKQALLTPINSFLGDHGTANVSSSIDGNNEANVTLTVTLDANTMPQFWFFISNQSALQSSLQSLGGNSLQTSLQGFTVLGSVATTAAAQAPTPNTATAAKATPPVSSQQASAPVTAAQATGSSDVPPVTSSASGTVTMNIGMTLYGSDVQPFTSEVQFHAASAMAGVFWIIIGTGSVQLISFSSTNATSEPSSTAKATTNQYGRKLLQAVGSPGASTSAESVVFAVTLPSASQNSLLVLQSSSATVRQQFAGWFVTQMQARGYNIDADVTSVSVSTVTGSAPAPTGASSGAQKTSSSSGTNIGAIVGGVVGGVVALALVGLVFMWLHYRHQRQRDLRVKEDHLTRESPEDIKARDFWDPTKPIQSPMYTKDADERKKTIISTLSDENSYLSSSVPLYHNPLYSHITELDSAYLDDVKRLLHKRRQRESAPLTETSEHQAAALLSALGSLETGSLYYDKYVVEQGQRRGVNSILAYARAKAEPHQQVVIKFLPDHGQYKHEKLFYENRQALEGEAATEYIPKMLDAFSGSTVIDTSEDEAIPPSLVLERGNFTLADWLSGKAVTSLEGKPEEVDRNQTLYNLCKGMEFLHARSLVHGSLTPDALMWFAGLRKWKMIGFGNWARSKEVMRVQYDNRYAAPELLLADLAGMKTILANESTDMWALGCIAFELLAGRELFGAHYSDEEVMSMLLGFVKLPWEDNEDFFTDNLPPSARNFVADLLQRTPEARKPIRTVLHSPLFTTDDGPTSAGTQTNFTHLNTPTGILSTSSQWN